MREQTWFRCVREDFKESAGLVKIVFSLSLSFSPFFSAYYEFFLWTFAFCVHRVHRAASLDFHRSILDVTLLPSQSYIPVKSFGKQFSKL